MKMLEYISSQSLCLAQPYRLQAWLARAQKPVDERLLVVRTSDDEATEDDPDSFYEDLMEASYPPRPSMVVNAPAGFAIIPVSGMITQGLSVFEQRYYGCCDTNDIGSMVELVAANPQISRVILAFDSPGGYTSGVPELAERIAELTAHKDTIAFTRGMMCSAAYWLGSQCGDIAVTPSSVVGSIGAYYTFTDMSDMAKQMGLSVRVFASGKFKGMGEPGTSLTPDQAALMQQKIDKTGTAFKAAVLAVRPGIPATAMEGQWFDGDECAALGLADQVVDNVEEILS